MHAVRWSSLLTAVVGLVVALAGLGGVATGHPWAWVPLVLGGGIAVREVRWLRRVRSGRIAEE